EELSGRHVAGVHRLSQGEEGNGEIRPRRRRLGITCELHPVQRRDDRGLGPAMQDLTAGRIDYLCDAPSTSKPQIDGGFVKAVATTGEQRWFPLPEVPTVREQGVDFVITAWQGLFLAQNTPEPIVRELNAALSKALDLPLVRERFTQLGEQITPPEHRSPE